MSSGWAVVARTVKACIAMDGLGSKGADSLGWDRRGPYRSGSCGQEWSVVDRTDAAGEGLGRTALVRLGT